MSADKRSSLNVADDELTTHLVVDKRGSISPWGRGNSKIGPGVYTFDRLPGKIAGTCPGSSSECEEICYAKRLVFNEPVWNLLRENSQHINDVWTHLRQLPADAKLVRIHVSGDFDSAEYIRMWEGLVASRPLVQFWGYTRSWRVATLLPYLNRLRAFPNIQLFASLDSSIVEEPPEDWRIAYIDGDRRLYKSTDEDPELRRYRIHDGKAIGICPEETGAKKNCVDCGFCFAGKRGDLVFLRH